MVFCYKIITETPRRSGSASPRKRSPTARGNNSREVNSSLSQLVNFYDYEDNNDVLDSIPEREWRLLAALARKREEDDEREKLADQFRKLWQREKEERELVEAETTEQYKRYISRKRRDESNWHEFRRCQKAMEDQVQTRRLQDCIRHKERKSADLLAWVDSRKTTNILEKAIDETTRAILAADKRERIGVAQQYRKHLELLDALKKEDDAQRRRNTKLRDASQRLAISNALSSWETSLIRQEVSAMDACRRAHHAAHVALTDARSARLARGRDARQRRARKVADITARMREAIRGGRS